MVRHGVLLIWGVDVVVDGVRLGTQAAHDKIKDLAEGVGREVGRIPVVFKELRMASQRNSRSRIGRGGVKGSGC